MEGEEGDTGHCASSCSGHEAPAWGVWGAGQGPQEGMAQELRAARSSPMLLPLDTYLGHYQGQ